MYRITCGSGIIALCDEPRFVRKKKGSGAFVQCSKDEADGVAVAGEVYNLQGKTTIEDAPEVQITKVDGGIELFAGYVDKNKYNSEISALENALCEMDAGGE